MTGAPWWVVLVAAAVGAAAGIGGSVWTSHVQRRTAARAEWFRRLQWAWELAHTDDVQSLEAGATMMDYLVRATDRHDAAIIAGIAPLSRRVDELSAEYASGPALDFYRADGDTNGETRPKEAGLDGGPGSDR